jgi:hypothetical protein
MKKASKAKAPAAKRVGPGRLLRAKREGITFPGADGKAVHMTYDDFNEHVRKLPMGRPKRGEAARPTVTRAVRLAPELWGALKEKAGKDGVPVNALLRTAVLKLLKVG